MLEKLHIKNIALISELEIEFKKGFNVLTGETGAGKSIIIDSINFLLGEKADKALIKSGTSQAEVSGLFSINSQMGVDALKAHDVIVEEDGYVLLNRTFNVEGKSSCKVNGKMVTVGMLKEISVYLMDIHGQYDHQSLLSTTRHLELLDRLAADEIGDKLEKYKKRYDKYKKLCKDLEDISGDDNDRQAKIDIYKFQISEIEMAQLKSGEEEQLLNQKKFVGNTVKIKDYTNNALDCLYRAERNSATDNIAKAVNDISGLASIDNSMTGLLEEIENVSAQLEGIVSNLREYAGNLEDSPSNIDEIELRLDLIYNLKKKYGSTIEEINKYAKEAKEKLDFIQNSEELVMEYTIRKEADERVLTRMGDEIGEIRDAVGKQISQKVEKILRDLGMINAVFNIAVTKKAQIEENGNDRVEFLISPNLGEEVKPLYKIASGGEMSRVMLALKVVLAHVDNIESFVFDEIDTGLSGRAAQRVAEKISQLAKTHQILCITHLPQIAAMADAHFCIEKVTEGVNTVVKVKEAKDDEIIRELARLIGGAEITEVTISAAADMKALAESKKITMGE